MKIFDSKVEFGFSCLDDGNLDFRFDDKNVVLKRREKFFTRENIESNSSVVMIAEHGNKMMDILKDDAGKGVDSADTQYVCDGLIAHEKNLNLILSVADCIALVLYDKKNETLAMVHVGSKNLAIGTVGKAIEAMKVDDSGIYVTTGPFIKKCCYEFDKIPEHLKPLEKYFIKENDILYHLDTEAALKDQLLAGGIKEENISISKLCSMYDGFPSHKRSQKEGLSESRMLVYARML